MPRPQRKPELPSPQELHERRSRFLLALRELDDAWVSAFHKTGLGDVYFSRLFTELWLRDESAVPLTEAYALVQGVSAQTAMKYIRKAIAEGYVEEFPSQTDGRSRLVRLTPRARQQFNEVMDRAGEAFSQVFAPPGPKR
jgi:Winged helix DNA-binding domain